MRIDRGSCDVLWILGNAANAVLVVWSPVGSHMIRLLQKHTRLGYRGCMSRWTLHKQAKHDDMALAKKVAEELLLAGLSVPVIFYFVIF